MNLLKLCILFLIACSPAIASEPAEKRRAEFLNKEYNRVSDNPVRIRSAKAETKTTTTTGYFGTEHVRMHSSTKGKTTTTKGFVNGRYIILKTEED